MELTNNRKRDTAEQASFHNTWLTAIKKTLGKKCLFISHVSKKAQHFLKIVMTNSKGGKDTIHYRIKGTPNELTSSDYLALLEMLKKGEYEQISKGELSSTTED